MYSIADTILQTDRGIVFVGQHEHDHNDQQVFAKLINYYLNSRIADIESNDILQYITSTRFGQGKWRRTAVSFISHRKEQVRQYNKLVEKDEEIQNKLKHSLLKTAVADVVELRTVQDTADQLRTNTGKVQTYDQYLSLLISAATTYDNKHKARQFSTSRNNNNRSAYLHQIDSYSDNEDQYYSPDEEEDFSVNTNINEIQAYATKFSKPKRPTTSRNSSPSSLLPLNIYQEMDSKSRSVWKQMNPDIRSKIVKLMSSSKPSPVPQLARPSYTPKKRVNLHEISLHDVMMSLQETEDVVEKADL